MSNTPKKYRLIGPPGTGKTTYLVNKLESLLEIYSCKKIAYCSFTKAAVEEASSRVKKRFGFKDTDTRWFRTIHSIGHSLLELGLPWKMVKKQNKIDFLDETYEGAIRLGDVRSQKYDEEEGLAAMSMGPSKTKQIDGAWLFKMYDHLLMNHPDNWDNEEFLDGEIDDLLTRLDVRRSQPFANPADIISFCQDWDQYKQHKRLYEFTDMLYQCWLRKLKPPVQVLIVDEFQDLTRIQYLLFEIWSEDVEEVWIAGDPNQAIYGFGGGTPKFLNEYPADETVFLDMSYRLPKKVLEYSKQILPGDQWLEKLQTANELDGEIVFEDYFEFNGRKDLESTFILCRTNRIIKDVAKQLSGSGIIFKRLGSQYDLTEAFLELYVAVIKYAKGEYLDRNDVKRLLENLKTGILKVKVKRGSYTALNAWIKDLDINPKFSMLRGKKHLSPSQFVTLFLDTNGRIPPNQDIVDSVIHCLKLESEVKANFLKSAYRQQMSVEQLTNPPITLGTIHKSKGREADFVLLVNKKNWYEDDEDLTDPEEERRVWYVAATRTRKVLHVMELERNHGTMFLPEFIDTMEVLQQ